MKIGQKVYEVHSVNSHLVQDSATVVWVNTAGTRIAYQLDAAGHTDPEGPVFGAELVGEHWRSAEGYPVWEYDLSGSGRVRK